MCELGVNTVSAEFIRGSNAVQVTGVLSEGATINVPVRKFVLLCIVIITF